VGGLSVKGNVSLISLTHILDWVNNCQLLKEDYIIEEISFFLHLP
jgi:hypothetical protein